MRALTPLKKYGWKVAFAPILKVIECITELIVPFLVRSIIDDGLTVGGSNYNDTAFIWIRCGVILGLALVGFGCTMVAQYISSRTATEFSRDLKNAIYRQVFRISAQQMDQYGKSKAVNLINNDAPSIQNGVFMFMRLVVRAPFLVVGSVVASFIVNVYAGIVVLCALALCALTILIVVLSTPKAYAALQAELDTLSSYGEDNIVGARVVRAFNKQRASEEDFEKHSETYRKRALTISRMNAFINPLTFAFVNLAIILIIYLGSFQASTTGLSAGSIVALINFLTQCLTALLQFTRLVTSLSKAWASKKRADAFLAIEPEIVDGPIKSLENQKEATRVFELRDASLSFGGEANVLDHINLTIEKGEKVGIIGGTGSGKSTLLSLLLRFNDPTSGECYFHDIPMKECALGLIRSDVAFVSQKPQLFKGTVRSNIAFGNPEASPEEIDKALADAQAKEFVTRYDDYIDHPIEEGGANLSGGQKQRILIARALLSKRSVLILDDSTSALDYKSDLLVRQAINRIEGLTAILVSQRATSIKDCQKIIVLDKGCIVGEGDHESLLKTCDIYREIYEAQVSQK
ncbi:MAG: ABC transporter ATP-binding protein/permease [Bacilli bacterium]|nr:ABC transporter ATP-binding protein/permease [Bacilli bacterium]